MFVQTNLTIKERENLDKQMAVVYTEVGYAHHSIGEVERLLKYCWKYIFPYFYHNWKRPDLDKAILNTQKKRNAKKKKGDSLIPKIPKSDHDVIDQMTLGALIYNWLNQVPDIDLGQEKWLRQFQELRNHFNHSSFYEQYDFNTENGVNDALKHIEVLKEHTRDLINILRVVMFRYDEKLSTPETKLVLKLKGKFYNNELYKYHMHRVKEGYGLK